MPAGAHWTLRYEPTVDDRVQARVDTLRLRQDEFVLSVERVPGEFRDPIFLEVQFGEDREGPNDPRITGEIRDHRRVQPPAPPDPERTLRSFREILEDLIRSPWSRSRVSQSMAAPIRSRLDYVSSGRRTLLVTDAGPLDQGQFGDALSAGLIGYQGSIGSFGIQGPQGVQGGLGQGNQGLGGVQGAIGSQGVAQGFTRTRIEAPEWLKPGVWARRGSDYIKVDEVCNAQYLWEPAVRFKFWRMSTPPQTMKLSSFLESFTQCEKPLDPTSRYERIIKGI
jgi:hypothetical protein